MRNYPNMSYCAHENTCAALNQCLEYLEEGEEDGEEISHSEQDAQKSLIELCERYLDETGRLDEIIDEATE